jgi:hypothetical protein
MLLIKVMQVCDHWPTDPPDLRFEPPRLHVERPRPSTAPFGPQKLLNFDFDADPDPSFHFNADPDPASKSNADSDPKPCFVQFFHLPRPRKMASRKPVVAAPADSQDPEMPDHDLEPPRFARRALERLLNDWPAVSAMLSTGTDTWCTQPIHSFYADPNPCRLQGLRRYLRKIQWEIFKYQALNHRRK